MLVLKTKNGFMKLIQFKNFELKIYKGVNNFG